jgi:protein-S-isoprenylcysteine O-methyltransferase Ste14
MPSIDFYMYTMHTVFWSAFGVTRLVLRWRKRHDVPETGPATGGERPDREAPFSRALLVFHMLAFATMYFGIGNAVIPGRVPIWFDGQRMAGSLVIVGGAALASAALVYFRSWRFRAALDQDHELATAGPFRVIRHPIYMGLNLLALGSAIWVPTPSMWAAVVLMVIGGGVRARAEETLLDRVFGRAYAEYRARTHRFMPFIY